LVHFHEVEGLAFQVFLLFVSVNEDGREGRRGVQIGCGKAKIILATLVVFEVEV
jgi:hypothetical protein